jgi:hypothetical protein
MLALAFFYWWYGSGWQEINKKMFKNISSIGRALSVSLLIRNLFDPWRRITTDSGTGLSFRLQAALDNTISRFVGFAVRLLVLLTALMMTIILAILALIQLILWPLLPPAFIATLILGLMIK